MGASVLLLAQLALAQPSDSRPKKLDGATRAKAMAALIACVREGRWSEHETVLFWHTGGVPGLFA